MTSSFFLTVNWGRKLLEIPEKIKDDKFWECQVGGFPKCTFQKLNFFTAWDRQLKFLGRIDEKKKTWQNQGNPQRDSPQI